MFYFKMEYLPIFTINNEPLIISTILDMGKSDITKKVIEYYDNKTQKPFFVLLSWHCVELAINETVNKIKTLFENDYVLLVNTKKDENILKKYGVNVLFCHHNCFLDYDIFKITSTIKKYDAIYIAQAVKWKRIELAKEIESLALICYENINDDNYDISYVNQLKKDNRLINIKYDQITQISPNQVCELINKSKVGLILSEYEGGNYATTEYLLCGLPVISTKNKGGRDLFFDQYNSIEINGNNEIKPNDIGLLENKNPNIIRLNTISLMKKGINDYNEYMLHLFPNVTISENGLFGNYTNKLIEWMSIN